MIQSVHRALDVLEYLADHPGQPQALGDIASAVGLNLSTCANLLKTLVSRSYAEQPVPRGGYSLGPMAHYLVRRGPYHGELVGRAEPPLRELARAVPENYVLARLHQGRLFMLCQVEGVGDLQVREEIVLADDVYRTANGRLLLAYLAPEELAEWVAARGLPGEVWPEVTSEGELRAALETIHQAGTYEDVMNQQIARASYPVREGDRVVAALGVFAPAFRFTGEYRDQALAGLRKVAGEISRNA